MWWKPPTRWKHQNLILKKSYKYQRGCHEHVHVVRLGACSTLLTLGVAHTEITTSAWLLE